MGRQCFHLFGPLLATFSSFLFGITFQVLETTEGSELHIQVFSVSPISCTLLSVKGFEKKKLRFEGIEVIPTD